MPTLLFPYFRFFYLMGLLSLFLTSCSSQKSDQSTKTPSSSTYQGQATDTLHLTRATLNDKILGMLLGSAIGDAMGAPTEMWSRDNIARGYGFVYDLDTMVRTPSPEGIWEYNLPAGGTTDDTRWKKFIIEFLTSSSHKNPGHGYALSNKAWAQLITERYLTYIDSLKNTDSFDPEPFEINARKQAWLQEWALVAKAFTDGDVNAYADALSHFYGGEMTCAGLLYTPVLGAFYPGAPERAYQEAFRLSLFDIGFARDISASCAAMVARAMEARSTPEQVFNVLRDVDPRHYFKSRLVGRRAYQDYERARHFIHTVKQIELENVDFQNVKLPARSHPDTLSYLQTQELYTLLDLARQDAPFHSSEIHLINLTALLYHNFDFEKTLAFVINYGRDNDTVAALTGAILGAYWGASRLPKESVRRIIEVNRKQLQIDLPALAEKLSEKVAARYVLLPPS